MVSIWYELFHTRNVYFVYEQSLEQGDTENLGQKLIWENIPAVTCGIDFDCRSTRLAKFLVSAQWNYGWFYQMIKVKFLTDEWWSGQPFIFSLFIWLGCFFFLRFASFLLYCSHIATWKQEIPNLSNRSRETRVRTRTPCLESKELNHCTSAALLNFQKKAFDQYCGNYYRKMPNEHLSDTGTGNSC